MTGQSANRSSAPADTASRAASSASSGSDARAPGSPLLAPRAGRGERPVPLGGGGRVLGAPRHVGQRTNTNLGGVVLKQPADVLDEERLRLRVALLVARARAQHQQALGPGGGHVEEIALAVETILAHRQHEPAGARDRAPILVAQERLGGGAARELSLLKPADQHRFEAARADRLGRRHLHPVRLGALAHRNLEILQDPVHARLLERTDGARLEQSSQLRESRLRRRQRSRTLELRSLEHVRASLVGSGEERDEAPLDLGHDRRRVTSLAQTIEIVEGPVLALPQLPRLRGAVSALPADLRLEAVGKPRHAQQARGPQVSEQVLGAPVQDRAAHECEQPAPETGVPEWDRAVERIRDAVRAKDLLDQRGLAGRRAEDDGHVPRLDPLPEQLEHARARELDLGSLATGGVEGDRGAGVHARARLRLEQAALDVVERPARPLGVVVLERRKRELPGPAGEQLLTYAGDRLEGDPAGLEGQGDRHIGPASPGHRLERVQLERREVVEAVDEQRRAAPALGREPDRVERPFGEQLGVGEPRGLDTVAVAAVDRGDLVGVGPARPVAGPAPEGRGQSGRVDHAASELGHESRGGAHESRLRGRLGEHGEARAADRLFHDQLALHGRGHRLVVAAAFRDLAKEPVEAQHARPEDGAALGKLTLGVLDVLEGGHHEDRLVLEPRTEPAQDLAGLGGVGGTGDEGQGHLNPYQYRTVKTACTLVGSVSGLRL